MAPTSSPSVTALLLLLVAVSNGVNAYGTCQVDTIQFTTTDALGPFYVENSPLSGIIAPRQLLMDPTDILTITGQVLGNNCVPLAGARIEAWYAGDEGYSDDLYRGQVMANDCGEFQFTQNFPAVYPQRPIPHVHYRISTQDGVVLLVTQLYFVGSIVAGYNPDNTKVRPVVNEADGSRSVHFDIYVAIPGTANVDTCEAAAASGEDTLLLPESTMIPTDADAMITAEPMTEGEDDESFNTTQTTTNMNLGHPCGSVLCGPTEVCCNPSCGTCVEPGEPCQQLGCLTPVEEEDEDDSTGETTTTDEGSTAISKSGADLFD